jgi:NAD(P)-dependent dehydrogenase (short-subunit alcohol dehydrogenase family)
MYGMAGKIALLTGASSGIGRASALELAGAGATVVIGDVDVEGALETAALVEAEGGRASARSCDVTVPEDLAALVAHAEDEHGGFDAVFGNAGLLQTAPLDELSLELFERHLAINLTANFLLAKLTAPVLRRRGGGSLIFTSSVGGLRGNAGSAAYNASKGGLVNLTRALADELGPDGIRVNCICPGWVDTPFNEPFWSHAGPGAMEAVVRSIPLRRQATPAEIAPSVVFLAGDGARYVTGEVLVIDGGVSAI